MFERGNDSQVSGGFDRSSDENRGRVGTIPCQEGFFRWVGWTAALLCVASDVDEDRAVAIVVALPRVRETRPSKDVTRQAQPEVGNKAVRVRADWVAEQAIEMLVCVDVQVVRVDVGIQSGVLDP